MTDLLVFDERVAATPVVRRYQGLVSPVSLSAAFGTQNVPSVNAQHRNRVFRLTATRLFAVSWDGLYESTDSGGTFTIVSGGFTAPAVGVDDRATTTGIYFAFGSNTTYLCGVFKNSSNEMVGWRLDLSTSTFAETIGVTVGASSELIGSEIMFNNALHWNQSHAGNEEFSWDPVGQVMTSYSLPVANGHRSTDYCVAPDGKLKKLAKIGTTDWRLFDFTGTWADVGQLEAFVSSPDGNTWRPAMFSDGTDVFVVYGYGNGGTFGHRVRRLVTPFGVPGTDITTTVLAGHAALAHTDDGGSASSTNSKRCLVLQDTEGTPGSLITYLAFAEDDTPSTPWSFYQWNGAGSALTFIGAGGLVGEAIPCNMASGGHRFYVPGQLSVRPLDRVGVAGGEQLRWRASGGGNRVIKFRFARKGQPTTSQATLIGTATGGGTRVGSEVQGHPADDLTDGTVTWDINADGVPPNDPNVVITAEITA